MIECNRCGQCCQKIYINYGCLDKIAERKKNKKLSGDYLFVHENFEIIKNLYYRCGIAWTVFRCKLYNIETGLCPIHENKPMICKGYPYYNKSIDNMVEGLEPVVGLYPGCSYEKLYYYGKIKKILMDWNKERGGSNVKRIYKNIEKRLICYLKSEYKDYQDVCDVCHYDLESAVDLALSCFEDE
jgi:Fe-S-cluster containining protein